MIDRLELAEEENEVAKTESREREETLHWLLSLCLNSNPVSATQWLGKGGNIILPPSASVSAFSKQR